MVTDWYNKLDRAVLVANIAALHDAVLLLVTEKYLTVSSILSERQQLTVCVQRFCRNTRIDQDEGDQKQGILSVGQRSRENVQQDFGSKSTTLYQRTANELDTYMLEFAYGCNTQTHRTTNTYMFSLVPGRVPLEAQGSEKTKILKGYCTLWPVQTTPKAPQNFRILKRWAERDLH